MKNKKFSFNEIFNLKNLIIFLFCLLFGILIIIVYSVFTSFSLYDLTNGSFVSAAIVILLGLLELVLNQGTLDIIAVGFVNLFEVFKKDGTKKYDGLYGYQEAKKEKRHSDRFIFLAMEASGIIILIVALIIYFVWKASL